MDILKLKKQTHKEFNQTLYYLVIRIKEDTPKHLIGTIVEKKLKDYFEYPSTVPIDYNIIYAGDLRNFYDYKPLVGKFKKRYCDGSTMYRNYCVSEEYQKRPNIFCNVAEDAHTSWNTVISALNSTNGIIIQHFVNDTRNCNPL